MKRLTFMVPLVAMAMMVSCGGKEGRVVVDTKAPVEMNELSDSLSWALGFGMAQQIASYGFEVNRAVLLQAICQTLDTMQQPLTQEQMTGLIEQLNTLQFMQRNKQQQTVQGDEDAYFTNLMQENPNVKKSDKGIYYEVVKEGNGRQGEIGLVAFFDFKGMLTNGQVFTQTYGEREPIRHTIGEPMIQGLQDGFCMMKAGSTYRFYIPSALAYGTSGYGDMVPPNAIVVYEVELHEVTD